MGAVDPKGYGRTVDHDGSRQLAHRVSYRLSVGEIPTATPHIDHLCRNTNCVNPDHLEPVTQTENNRRIGLSTHCGRGHSLSEDNVYQRPGGTRECRTCVRDQPSRQPQGDQ
ncbi:HNH endonuclease signature motif containing protein [Streptomyces sp. NBC_00723]|uniref:HNH endonuclease signature motif containing protein n=1 Tax=Streptomyces sp. NBC_00723 TaxID=2903673 RepID=UPI00386FB1FF